MPLSWRLADSWVMAQVSPSGVLLLIALSACEPTPGGGASPADATWLVRARYAGAEGSPSIEGPRAEGIPGDLLLSNGLVVALMDAVAHDSESGLPSQHRQAPSGGTLLDFAPEGELDGFVQAFQAVEGDLGVRVFYQTAGITEDGRSLEAVGRLLDPAGLLGLPLGSGGLVSDIVVTTTWRMADHVPALEIETTVANQSGLAVQLSPLCDLVLVGGSELTPFVPSPGWGATVAAGEPVLAPWVTLAGDAAAPTSYAVVPAPGDALLFEALADVHGALRAISVAPPPGSGGTLNRGQRRTWRRTWLTSAGADTTAVTAQVVALLGARSGSARMELGLRGTASLSIDRDPSLAMEVVFERLDPDRYLGQDGEIHAGGILPVASATVTASRGAVTATLPLGVYRISPTWGGEAGSPVVLTVAAQGTAEATLDPTAAVRTPVTVALAAAGGAANGEPVRLTVVGLGGTADPLLQPWGPEESALLSGHRAWTSGGSLRILLPAGAYRVIASRGPFAPLAVGELRVPFQDGLGLVLPADTLDLGDWRSLDPVTASSTSFPGGDVAAAVATALCAERIDLFVRAEDDASASGAAGCDGQLAVQGALGTLDVPWQGSPAGDGWWLAAPVAAAPPGAGLSAATWLDQAGANGAVLTAILAPRAEGVAGQGRGLFAAWGFDRDTLDDPDTNAFLRAESAVGTTVLDASALEILSPADPWHTQDVMRDWLALLGIGARLAPLASSHGLGLADGALGAARTLVRADGDDPEALLRAAAVGHACISSGPLIDIVATSPWGSAGPGETLAAAPGDLIQFDISVRAADWVPVARVRLLAESRELWTTETQGDEPAAIQQHIERILTDERWFLVEAGRPEVPPGGDYALVYPDLPSFALCAPIWVEPPSADTGI